MSLRLLPQTTSGNKYILIVVDYFTKWPEAYPIPDQEAATVAEMMKQHWLSRHFYLLQDQETAFFSKLESYNHDDMRRSKLHKVDGHSLVHKMSHDLTKHLEKKMEALEISDVNFVKMKDFSDNDPRLVYSEKFKKPVNYSYSAVHIPDEIYVMYPEILNGLKWSAALDKVFQENAKNDPGLMWQYFGSHSGFMRTYPAHQWKAVPRKPNFPDLFDARLRPWYVHASSSPKDVVILMDTSGSMHGQPMQIMKVAVKAVLTTFGENDFINVASFSSTTEWVSCFDTLVQANDRNKQIFYKDIDALEERHMAKLSLALEFAFQALAQFRENRTERWAGAECNQIIMLFSDGGTEQAWEVLEKYNPDKELPEMASERKLKDVFLDKEFDSEGKNLLSDDETDSDAGYFTAIQAYGQIRTKIQDYVKVLSRPLVLSGEKHFEWTNFYIDAMGLGMMTTITLPVFNRTETGNQTMVGIMGVDVSLQEFLEYEPSYEMGPIAYSFGINHNGYVVFYPDLKTEFEFTEDPLPIDFLDIEIQNSAKEELREAMINLETSKRSLTSLLKMPDREHVVRHHMEYYYTPVNKTSFSIAIVIPTDRTHYLVAEEPDVSESLNLLDFQMLGMHIAPWKYCHGAILKMTTPEIMSNLSKSSRETPKQCKIQLLQRLAWDIRKTEDIIDYWQSEQQEGKRKGVVATFVQTESGLTRIYPPRFVKKGWKAGQASVKDEMKAVQESVKDEMKAVKEEMKVGQEEMKREITCMIENKFVARESRIDAVENKVGYIEERVSSVKEQVQERMSSVKEQIQERVSAMKQQIDERVHAVGKEASFTDACSSLP
ncbi:Voltage-dependent calcium channel subunit alpha-2/delta-1, partial [Stegodyphus mimosarum]